MKLRNNYKWVVTLSPVINQIDNAYIQHRAFFVPFHVRVMSDAHVCLRNIYIIYINRVASAFYLQSQVVGLCKRILLHVGLEADMAVSSGPCNGVFVPITSHLSFFGLICILLCSFWEPGHTRCSFEFFQSLLSKHLTALKYISFWNPCECGFPFLVEGWFPLQ